MKLYDIRADTEKTMLENALSEHGTVVGAAKALGLPASSFYRLAGKYGIVLPRWVKGNQRKEKKKAKKKSKKK